MKRIAEFLFEARMLKQIPRSGFPFLGSGRETVAEHVYMTALIGWSLARTTPGVDAGRVVALCLLHDLPEARTGDLNSVHKHYVRAEEERAAADLARGLPFGAELEGLLAEFRSGKTPEAALARDADQISLLLDLKDLQDIGFAGPREWLPYVLGRLQTEAGKALARAVLETRRDAWWRPAADAHEALRGRDGGSSADG